MVFPALACFLMKSALVLGAVHLVGRAFRRRAAASARLRLDLAAFIAIPFLALSSIPNPLGVQLAPAPSVPEPRAEARGLRVEAVGLAQAEAPLPAVPRAAPSAGLIPVSGRLATAISLAWLAGSLLSLASILVSLGASQLSLRSLRPCTDPEWLSALATARRRLGIRATLSLLVGQGQAPFVAGILYHRIVVPPFRPQWTAQRKLSALLHELGHVKRRDLAWRLFAEVSASLVWCIPFSALILRRMALDREEACDELAIRGGADPIEFASLLLELSRSSRLCPMPGALSLGRGHKIERRIQMLLELKNEGPGRHRARGLLVLIALVAMAASFRELRDRGERRYPDLLRRPPQGWGAD